MLTDRFWGVVDAARARAGITGLADADEIAEYVVEALIEWSPRELIALGTDLEQLDASAFRWDLWAASRVLTDSADEEDFEDFRGWLLAQGPTIWEETVLDPDSLARWLDPRRPVLALGEDMAVVAADAYEQLTGNVESYWNAIPDDLFPPTPLGDPIDVGDPDAVRARLPVLTSLYLIEA